MTAEVAILNRSAVALAADSALTVGRRDNNNQGRVWKSTNKLFLLSSYNDIGIMIYNAGDFCGVPWEIIIKEFRRSIGKKEYDKLNDAIDDFCEFINKYPIPKSLMWVTNVIIIILSAIDECREAIKSHKNLEKRKQFRDKVNEMMELSEDKSIILGNLTREYFSKNFSQIIKKLLEDGGGIHVTKGIHTEFITLCYELVRRDFSSTFHTGVVFAGYGKREIFPVMKEIIIDGRLAGRARAWDGSSVDLNEKGATPAFIKAFAQADMAYLFMEGLHQDYLEYLEVVMSEFLNQRSESIVNDYVAQNDRLVELSKQKIENKKLIETFFEEFQNLRKKKTISPMMEVVSSLPKEEMAAMAEALVEITSLKRKMDSNIESVGGPVDVAVISKADGFVWIKRKHYFSSEINGDFLLRRARKYGGGAE